MYLRDLRYFPVAQIRVALFDFDDQGFHRHNPSSEHAAAAMKAAAAMERWELVDLAVDWLLPQQQVFVRWWRDTVHRKGGERWLDSQVLGDQRLLTADAETRTGITKQTVSRTNAVLEPPLVNV